MSKVIERARPTTGTAPLRVGRFLWEAFWIPFWLGSTLPPPALPTRRERSAAQSERTPLLVRQLDTLRDTIWRQRRAILAFRALWLALTVAAIWLGFRVLAHRELPLRPLLIVVALIVVLGATLIALARPSRGQLARTLDRSFGLRERVATALEGTQGDRLAGVRALQVLEAMRVTQDVSTASAFRQRLPVRELALAIIAATVCIVFGILLFMRQLNPATPAVGPNGNTPPGVQAPGVQNGVGSQPNQQNGAGQQGQQGQPGGQNSGQSGQPSAQGQHDLDTLAGALQDNAATRQAANKLANGDNAGAAQALRDAGAQSSQMSPDSRQELANDLQTAAGKTSDPQLAQDLRDLADKLTGPNPSAAQGAFEQVANDVDRIGQGGQQGQQPGQNGQQGDTGQQGQNGGQSPSGGGGGSGSGAIPQLPNSQQSQDPTLGQATPLLGADGKPIELPKGNANGSQIDTQNPNSRGNGQTDPGAAGAGGGQLRQGAVGDSGVDPNQVPFDQRGTVERYFTPPAEEGR
jgi:hypothetical protein